MQVEIDPAKAVKNLKKDRVSFEEAASVYSDPMAFTFSDPDHSVGEQRWLMFGMSNRGRLLAVIYTYRRERARLISARLATQHERTTYEEG